ncbi:MAG: InlB B-repeat-containing protein [Lachnospiraceae bacterium]|nr:InlB B-repeat-containing protein [Lachnospiraceae bacterium]
MKSKGVIMGKMPAGILHRVKAIPVLFFMIMLLIGFCTKDVHADALIWHEVDLKPGQDYDITDCGWNTTIFIKQPGSYRLSGHSEHVRVVIQSEGANVYLADGLNINCGTTSYAGSRTAAVWVDEFSGTAKLISEAHANIYFEGYMCPAIRKEGTKSQLVFETMDPNDPGTITAQSGVASPGIGGVLYISGSNTLGNITINSGNIIATGTGAGIGGGDNCSLSNFTVNGGNIKAYGGMSAAAIGGGNYGSASGITINGGTIYAECSTKDSPEYFSCHGGAIGSGNKGKAEHIRITGGDITVINHGAGPALGGWDSANIEITGGTIKAINQGGGPGIGSGGPLDLSISGGDITAQGGPIAYHLGQTSPGIGAGFDTIKDSHITINGGTINAKAGCNTDFGIGAKNAGYVHIKGGSVFSDGISGLVTNGSGSDVHRVDVTIDGVGDNMPVISMECAPDSSVPYGFNDVVTKDGGKIYLWLPSDERNLRAVWTQEQGKGMHLYGGTIPFSNSSGVLKKGTMLTLKPKTPGDGEEGIAFGLIGERVLWFAKEPKCADKKILEEYCTESETKLAYDNGALLPDVTGFTNSKSEWTNTWSANTIYYKTRSFKYNIHFVANEPRNASTTMTGNPQDMSMTVDYGVPTQLRANVLNLPGYDFDGWNTRADGSGTAYANKQEITNLSDKDGGTVTLYAKWKAKKYSITLGSEKEGGGTYTHPFEYYFDSSSKLPTLAQLQSEGDFRPPSNKKFHAWVLKNENGGTIKSYGDGANFINLCDIDGSGNLTGKTLEAEWIDNGNIKVTTTENGIPVDVADTMKIALKSDQRKVIELSEQGTGSYIASLTGIEAGDYLLSMESINAGVYSIPANKQEIKGLTASSSVSVLIEYYTVEIGRDPDIEAIMSVVISDPGFIDPETTPRVANGDKVAIQTNMKDGCGYHFDGYSVKGIMPGNSDNSDTMDLTKPDQTITIGGKVVITAHAVPNEYTVKFDKNGGSYIEGEMEDQKIIYDQPQPQPHPLFANKFTCAGGTFAGWNTKKDGSGTSYTDGQSVENLTTEDGGVVTLYAQWDMQEYGITYNLAEGTLPAGRSNPDKYRMDSPTFTLVNPEKEDYDFVGWTGTNLTAPTKSVVINEGSTGDRRYSALFDLKIFNVRFEDNGGTGTEPQRVAIHNKAVRPEDPTRENFDFTGWFADPELTTPFDFDKEITADTTLYAGWKSRNVESISLGSTKLLLQKGKTKKLTATVIPEDAVNKELTWKSSKNDVVTVTGSGLTVKLKGKKKGTAVITAATKDGTVKATCKVTVREASQMPKLKVGKTGLTIAPGSKAAKVSVRAVHDTVKSVVSSNSTVAKVKYNKKANRVEITPGNYEGKASITITTGWGLTKTVKVKVKMPDKMKRLITKSAKAVTAGSENVVITGVYNAQYSTSKMQNISPGSFLKVLNGNRLSRYVFGLDCTGKNPDDVVELTGIGKKSKALVRYWDPAGMKWKKCNVTSMSNGKISFTTEATGICLFSVTC